MHQIMLEKRKYLRWNHSLDRNVVLGGHLPLLSFSVNNNRYKIQIRYRYKIQIFDGLQCVQIKLETVQLHIHSSISLQLLRYNVSDPFKVWRVALVDGQADDLGHLVRMVRAGQKGNDQSINSVAAHF